MIKLSLPVSTIKLTTSLNSNNSSSVQSSLSSSLQFYHVVILHQCLRTFFSQNLFFFPNLLHLINSQILYKGPTPKVPLAHFMCRHLGPLIHRCNDPNKLTKFCSSNFKRIFRFKIINWWKSTIFLFMVAWRMVRSSTFTTSEWPPRQALMFLYPGGDIPVRMLVAFWRRRSRFCVVNEGLDRQNSIVQQFRMRNGIASFACKGLEWLVGLDGGRPGTQIGVSLKQLRKNIKQ